MRATIFLLAAFLCGAAHCTDGSDIITEVKGKITTVVDDFVALLDDVVTTVLAPVKQALAQSILLVKQLIEKIKSALGVSATLWNTLPIGSTIGLLESSLTSLISLLEKIITKLLSEVASLLENLLSIVFGLLDEIEVKLTGSTSTCSDAVYSTLLSLITTLDQQLSKCITDLKDSLLAVVNLALTPLNKIINGLQSAIASIPSCSLLTIVTCLLPALAGAVLTTVTSLVGAATSLFSILGGLSDVASAVNTCTEIQNKVVITGVTGALSTLVTCISG